MTLRVLDLFSGIGGFSLGLERAGGFKTVSFCEINSFARQVLAKQWPDVPCHDDITTREFQEGEADVIVGGFPCQDVSLAGKRAGISGERSGLYREMVRAIRVVRPRYAIMENVANLLADGMGPVLGDLASDGYDAEWDCISASDVGAPHGRNRIWIIITDPNKFERSQRGNASAGWWLWSESQIEEAHDTNGSWKLQPPRLLGNIRRWIDNAANSRAWWPCDWKTKFEAFRRMDDGFPDGLDRSINAGGIRTLGNALLPQIPELIGRAIMSVEGERITQP
jgi:DNA (cytosine-5)-methyltransferase 1